MEHPVQVADEDAEFVAEVIAEIGATEAPRRFWLCQTADIAADMVVGWGLVFEEQDFAVLFARGKCVHLHVSDSAERIHARYSRICCESDLQLVWVDPAADIA